jgi:two-component system, sensor histidine kinase and response regulator
MKKSILLFVFLCSNYLLWGQTDKDLNLLLEKLNTNEPDSSRLKTLIKVVDILGSTKSPRQLGYIDLAEPLAKKLNDHESLIRVYNSRGNYYTHRGDYAKSLENFLASAKIIEKTGNQKMLVSAYLGIGQAFSHLGQKNDKAKEYYDKAEALVLKIKHYKNYSSVFEQIAFYHYLKDDFDTCLKYHFKALGFAKQHNSPGRSGDILNEIGLTYIQKKDYTLALEYLQRALGIYKNLHEQPLTEMAYVYLDMGLAYSEMGKYEKAKENHQISIQMAKKAENPETEMENYDYLANVFEKQKDYKNQSIYLKKYYSIKDSLFSSDSKNKITELEADFQIEKKNTEIARKEIQINQSNYQRKVWGGIAVFLLTIVGFLGYFYRKLKTKNQEIGQQKEELQQLNHIKDRLFAVLSHDLRNPLATLKTYFSLISKPNLLPEKKEIYTRQTLNAVNSTSELMDNLLLWANSQIRNHKLTLTKIGLDETIGNTIELVELQAQQKAVLIVSQIEVKEVIANQNALETILRNLLTNAIKFSPSNSTVTIKSFYENNRINISVSDEGIGLSPEKIEGIYKSEITNTSGTMGEKGSGLGLILVRELAKQINANLEVESKEGLGSSFKILF